ncbi:hypothetical protein [uncultured Helicobacter sp.]|uniref:hypothetical protein n=1 Tax=uncultured Helicobacter sp. TaxID=175537 RepID=UPI00374F110D
MAYEELSDKQRALLTQSHLEYHTRKAMRVFWKVFGIGGGIATLIALALAIFGGYNELFGYVGGVWLLGLPIFGVLSYALLVLAMIIGGIYEGIIEQIGWYRFVKK